MACMHCTRPPCAEVCRVTCIYPTDDCPRAASKDLCISCGHCFYACPLAAPQYPMVNFGSRQDARGRGAQRTADRLAETMAALPASARKRSRLCWIARPPILTGVRAGHLMLRRKPAAILEWWCAKPAFTWQCLAAGQGLTQLALLIGDANAARTRSCLVGEGRLPRERARRCAGGFRSVCRARKGPAAAVCVP
jgi:hypothetical protein